MSVKNPPTPKQFAPPSSGPKSVKKPVSSGTNGTATASASTSSSAPSDSATALVAKPTPKHKEVMDNLLRDMGITLYDPQLPAAMLDVAHKVTKRILSEAHAVSDYAGKKQVDSGDVKFGIQAFDDSFKAKRPTRQFMMDLAFEKNSHPLPPIRQNFGLKLPNDRFCQVQPNFRFKGPPKKTPAAPTRFVAVPSQPGGAQFSSGSVASSLLGKRRADDDYD
ncbi:transcription initiation factor IID31kD subunit [Aphelenchoides avenae]|nr:transcription initiation factor IID31kD subunit [Aphelenchus avenae]